MRGLIMTTQNASKTCKGQKTETRRLVKQSIDFSLFDNCHLKGEVNAALQNYLLPFSKIKAGDKLYIKEPLFAPKNTKQPYKYLSQNGFNPIRHNDMLATVFIRDSYMSLWDSINPQNPHKTSPLVFVYSFKKA